jgi:hypothetical protein
MGAVASPSKPVWKIDPSIDADRVSLEDVKLIFSQAEKRLDDTVRAGENIASKTMSVITLMAGIFVALSGFMIANWGSSTPATKRAISLSLGAAIFWRCLFTRLEISSLINI